jgi:hypothetical protein
MTKQPFIENLLPTHQFVGDADALVDQCKVEPLAKACFGFTLLYVPRKTRYIGSFRGLYSLFWTAWLTFSVGIGGLLGLIALTS